MAKNKYIESPEKMAEHFLAYTKYCKDNPKYEHVVVQRTGAIVKVPREVPVTWDGFEIWLSENDILQKLDDYKENKDNRYSEYADILTRIGKIIYVDKFNGATAGIFNHNIIARDLGLSDKKEIGLDKETKEVFKIGGEEFEL